MVSMGTNTDREDAEELWKALYRVHAYAQDIEKSLRILGHDPIDKWEDMENAGRILNRLDHLEPIQW